MRNLFILLVLFVLPAASFGQNSAELAKNGLPDGAKVIVISSDLGKDELFSAIGKVLFDNGYEVKLLDKNSGIIQTEDQIVKGSIRIRMSIFVEEKIARIRSKVILPGAMFEDLVNQKSFNSIHLTAFSEMDRIAKLVPQTKIEYQP